MAAGSGENKLVKIGNRIAANVYRKPVIIAGFILLLLHLLEFPHHTFDATHDLSSHASFEYYAAKRAQFGTEICQNVGPYGYVHYAYSYIGYLHEQKIALKSICRFVLVLLIFWMGGCLKSPVARLGWVLSFFVFYSFGDDGDKDFLDLDENLAYVTVYLSSLWLLQDRKDRAFRVVSAAMWCFLAFLALTKHTCFVLACSIAVAVFVQNLIRRNFFQALVTAVASSGWLVLHWWLAGQQWGNLRAFVRGVFAFSGGYNEAMALDTPAGGLALGLIVVILYLSRIVFNWWQGRREVGRAMVDGFILFVIWKHGFVRSDVAHMMIMFYAVLLFVIPLFYYEQARERPALTGVPIPSRRHIWLRQGWCLLLVLLCTFSFYLVIPGCKYNPRRLWKHYAHNMAWLFSPLERTRQMEAELRAAKVLHELPVIKSVVGSNSIDLFGYNPGHILLNDLNYSSRPMPITFAAANQLLQEANEQFYRNPQTAPAFVLCQMGGVDNRLYFQDDAKALRALFDLYRPMLAEKGLVLLQRRESAPASASAPQSRLLAGEGVVKFGQAIPLNRLQDQLIWLEARVEHSWLGRMLSFFYKTPSCFLGLELEGSTDMNFRKFVTAMGECGFVLDPLLESNMDIATVYDPNKDLNEFGRLARIAFACDEGDRKFFKDEIRIRLFAMQRPAP